MSIKVDPVSTDSGAASGLSVGWDGGQFVMIVGEKGIVSCGVIDMAVMNRFDAAIAVARGTPEKALVTSDDLLNATIAEVTDKAAALGVKVGMTGREALEVLG
jgi:uncharacterized protein YunC (DUF1805 family)